MTKSYEEWYAENSKRFDDISDNTSTKTVREVHTAAMDFFVEAELEKYENGRESEIASCLLSWAFELEQHAAYKIKNEDGAEPTRSILFRSAACLGLQVGASWSAVNLAEEGLKGKPRPSDERILKAIAEGKVRPNNYKEYQF